MGRAGSSSKRKSSKKKSSKTSPEVLRRKRSKRNKSKKLRRRDDSSSYSDDESTSSVSISYSSSEDDYKSRKGRSRLRNNVKSNRKRARRSSSNRESSKDSPRLRKRKRSKKNGDSELRKKSQKKKPRRDASKSPRNSDSRICSSYRSGSTSSGGQSEFERLRGSSRENTKGKRDSSKARSGTKKSKNRSRSGDSNGNHGNEHVAGEINLRRLKSVITVTKEPREVQENERYKDEHTEEIVYDHDDYPSCRSNDSNDGGSKRELVHPSHIESDEKRRRVETLMGEEAFVSNLPTNESIVSDKDDDGQYDGLIPCSDRVGTNSPEKENESDNMESVLRQKALENLRRFQGGRQKNAKTSIDQENKSVVNMKKLSTTNDVCVESKLPKQDASTVVGATQLVGQNLRPKLRRDSSGPIRTEGKILAGRYSGTESGAANHSVVCPPDGAVYSGILKGKNHPTPHSVGNKSESSISSVRQESLCTGSTLKQAPMSQASPKATLLVTKTILSKNSTETTQTVAVSGSNNQSLVGVIDASESAPSEPSSCVKPTSEEHSSRERQDEAKDSAQFEQKTMSVMRGGEMVQVNYKVYIPKKAPALARRKLQR